MRKEGVPLYLIAGKRTQHFGVFENHLVTDPMHQDAYETKSVGMSLGYNGPMGLDASISIYNGEEMMDHLFESGVFDSDSISRVSDPAGDDVSSYIINLAITPIAEHLSLSASYLSEPGNGKRNASISLAANYDCLFINGLNFNAEYITALEREKYQNVSSTVLKEGFKERIFSFSAAYRVVDPFEVALRYEHFDDDGLAVQTDTWSVKDRYSMGSTYTFYENWKTGESYNFSLEYHKIDYRLSNPVKAFMDYSNTELYMKLGLDF